MERPRIVIASLSPLDKDRRVRRQLHFLHNAYRLTAAGFTDPAMDGVGFIEITRPSKQFAQWPTALRRPLMRANVCRGYTRLLLRRYEAFYWNQQWVRGLAAALEGTEIDLFYANEIEMLPLAVKIARSRGSKVYLDAHEFTPRQYDHRWRFRVFFQPYWDYLCRRYLTDVSKFVTVSESIAKEFERLYEINCEVATNAPFFENLSPRPVSADGTIRMVHHGHAVRDRGLEQMIDLMKILDERFRLEYMLVSESSGYVRELQELARGDSRVTFRDPVPGPDIPSVLNEYDLGLYLLRPISSNQRLALPNKLFDFIQARLGVAIWPSVEMKRVVEEFRCGIVADRFSLSAIADKLRRLSPEDVFAMKRASGVAAKELCAEKNGRRLQEVVGALLAHQRGS